MEKMGVKGCGEGKNLTLSDAERLEELLDVNECFNCLGKQSRYLKYR